MTEIKLPQACIKKSLPEFGGRVYEFEGRDEEIPKSGWVDLSLDRVKEEQRLFYGVRENGRAYVVIHACPQLPEKARYAWQSRNFKPPRLPSACPRCRYRLDYKPKRPRI